MRRISEELPESIRARVILELASDLEALAAHHRSRGLDEEEAARRAEETLVVSPESLRRLVAVHTTTYQRWASAAAGRLRWGLDLALFTAGVAPMLLGAVVVVVRHAPSPGNAPLLWPMILVVAGVAGIAAVKSHQLFVARERDPSRLHRGLDTLVALGVAGPLLGFLAALAGVQRLLRALEAGPGDAAAVVAIAEQAGRDASVVAVGLLLAFGAGIVWFVLVDRIAEIERRRSAELLALDWTPHSRETRR